MSITVASRGREAVASRSAALRASSQAVVSAIVDDEPLDLMRHLGYEIDTAVAYFQGVHTLRPSSDIETMSRNALLEGVLLHFRGIIEFLVGRPPRRGGETRWRHSDDIQPSDFLHEEWFASVDLQPILDRIDKEIVHISKHRARIEDLERQWDLAAVGRQMHAGLSEFMAMLATDPDILARLRPSVDHLGALVGVP